MARWQVFIMEEELYQYLVDDMISVGVTVVDKKRTPTKKIEYVC